MGILKNQILIAMPHMVDPLFSKSVIYVCEHNKYGAFGLIINKKIENQDIRLIFRHETKQYSKFHTDIYFGGPISIENGIVLHHAKFHHENTVKISSTISMTNKQKILKKLKTKNNIPFKLALGHCGWAPDQLEKEIGNGDWLMQQTTDDFVFNFPSKQMWTQATHALGIEIGSFVGNVGKT